MCKGGLLFMSGMSDDECFLEGGRGVSFSNMVTWLPQDEDYKTVGSSPWPLVTVVLSWIVLVDVGGQFAMHRSTFWSLLKHLPLTFGVMSSEPPDLGLGCVARLHCSGIKMHQI